MNSKTEKVEEKSFTLMTQQERNTHHNHHNNMRSDQESDFGGLSAIDGMGREPSEVKSQLSYHQLMGDSHNHMFTREENVNHFERKNHIRAIRNNRKPDVASGVVSIRIDPPKVSPVVQERKAIQVKDLWYIAQDQ